MHTNQINCLSRDPALYSNHQNSLYGFKKNTVFSGQANNIDFLLVSNTEKKVQQDKVFWRSLFSVGFWYCFHFNCVLCVCSSNAKWRGSIAVCFICSLVQGLVHYLVSVALFSKYTMNPKPYRIKWSKCCSIMDWIQTKKANT